jgi:hypothetical protein
MVNNFKPSYTEGFLFNGYLSNMKIILTESQLKTVVNESSQKVRYFEGDEYDITEQIDWLVMQKEFIYLGSGSGHNLKLINIIKDIN